MFNVYALATEFQGKWENAVVIADAHTVNNPLNCSRKVKTYYDVQFKGSSITRTDENGYLASLHHHTPISFLSL